MKNLRLFSILAFALMLFTVTSCTTDDDGNLVLQPPIDIPTTAENVEIPFATLEGVNLPGPFPVEIDVDFDQEISDAVPGLGLDDVERAQLEEFYVELDDSSFVGDLTAIKDMDIYVTATDVDGNDLEEIKVAEVRDNDDADRIDFDIVSDEDLAPYMRSENLYIVLKDIVPGDNSLTTFTVSVTPVWRAEFEL